MRTRLKTYTSFGVLAMMLFQILMPFQVSAVSNDEVIYPLKKISKLECRFEDFDTLSSSCKQALPILNTKDYSKYAKQNGWYNDYTRIYTVLWGSSYKYWWDVGNGGHLGTDIATAKGTPVYSIADGKVTKTGNDVGWGKYVSIEHTVRGKKIVSNYAHLSEIKVSLGDKVDVWDKIGEVGSTGNSTGNHLHFQIDLPHTFHPYYYDWNSCPYSYYEISESDKCFDDLAAHTLDPLEFLETNGAILDEIEVVETSSSSTSSKSSEGEYDYSIFNVTISPEGDGTKSEIKELQRIYRDLGYYDGSISGRYNDLEDDLIRYQIDSWVIASEDDIGAGWFGPKTRAQTKKDYVNYLESGEVLVSSKTDDTEASSSVVRKVWDSKKTVEKVSREDLMTREEIEAMEVQEFLDIYNINFSEDISQIQEWQTKTTLIEVKNDKGRGYKGSTPGNVTFEYDSSKISVFPEKFYHFTDGEREIYITGKTDGHTTLRVKIGDVIVKEFSISVGEQGQVLQSNGASIYIDNSSILWDTKTAVVIMKDQYGNKLVKSRYEGNFEIYSDDEIEYCVKRGTIQDIKSIYNRKCLPSEYTDNLSFNYDDTIGWILVFDYKVLDTQSAKIELKSHNAVLAQKIIKTQVPKWLDKSYTYFDEVIESLSLGITDGIRNDYFLKDKELSELDAKNWIANTLKQIDSSDSSEKLKAIKKEQASKYVYLTREEFLDMTAKYLWDISNTGSIKTYKDLSEEKEILVASILWNNYEWKDTFWEDYFQPDKKISRGEAAYLLMQVLKKQWWSFLAAR